MRRPVVTIDGPAGAGKTTVTKRVAHVLGYLHVDTGALYRVVALAAARAGLSFDDEPAVSRLAEQLAREGSIRFEPRPGAAQRILLSGDDVSEEIRSQELGQGASRVSALGGVRAALLEMQRASGCEGGVVLEGRDIGTVVFPDAQAKFFLTASVEVRAERRHRELVLRGVPSDLAAIRREVVERDHRDSSRPIAPLRQADDAVLIDSSALTVDEVVERIVDRVRVVERELEHGPSTRETK